MKNGEEAVDKIKKEHPEAKISMMQLDLGSLRNIEAFAKKFLEMNLPLNILINNAGVACPKALTQDGIEMIFGVNHIGHFYLTKLLLPALEQAGTVGNPSRVVNLSSLVNWMFAPDNGIKFDDINGDKDFTFWERYGKSKLANILFSRELNQRMKAENKNIISVSLHPGGILRTEFSRHMTVASFLNLYFSLRPHTFWQGGVFQKRKTIEQGSATSIVCALDPDVIPGEYYADSKLETRLVHPKASDTELAKKLWDFIEELIASKTSN